MTNRGNSVLLTGLVVMAALALQATSARAQPTDAAVAEQLFEQAQALMEAHRLDEACPKFAESHRLDPAGGTILLLAQCHEEQGKLATAWAEYKESLARAKEAGNARRERISRERIAALEPLLSTLTIIVPPEVGRLPGFRLTHGGVVLGAPLWGTAMNVDGGSHELTASADGHEVWSSRAEVGPRSARVTVTVPALAPRPEPPPAASSSSPPTTPLPAPAASSAPSLQTTPPPVSRQPDRVPALFALGVGAVGLGLGGYFGARSIADASFANDRCPEKACADAEAVRRGNDAVRGATLSNVAFGVGLLATGIGAYLWFSAPSASPQTASRVQVGVSPNSGRLAVGGRVSW